PTNQINRIYPTGLPPQNRIPTAGYFDWLRYKIVVWYNYEVYESSDGINFRKISPICSCGNGQLNSLLEQCDIVNGNPIFRDQVDCKTFGFAGGNLKCGNDCNYNVSQCVPIKINYTCSKFDGDKENCENPTSWNNQILKKIEDHNRVIAEKNGWPYDFCTNPISQVKCSCFYSTYNNKCLEKVEITSGGGQCFISNIVTSSCNLDNTATESWIANWNSPTGGESPENGCVSGSRLYNCQLIAKVPFFNILNLIIASLFIFLIYLIYNKQKKKCDEK
ncbi:MAG: hypothetical protein QXI33_01185, partial [Candidatus Pacearchaeota archaeon]